MSGVAFGPKTKRRLWGSNNATGRSWTFGAEMFWWGAALIAFPFYILDKGSMQLSSLLILFAAAASFYRFYKEHDWPLQKDTVPLLLFMAAFVTYAAVVSFTWAIILSDSQVLMPPLYYLFNLIVVFLLLSLYKRYGADIVSITRWIIFASVVLQFVLSFFFAHRGFREMLFFKNANQLGYYALVCASILALPLDRGRSALRDSLFSLGVLMCLWLALLSLSKAATLSCTAFLLLSGARNRFQIMFALIVGIVLLTSDFGVVENRVANLETRFASFGQDTGGGGDDNLEGRGYDRIWDNPEMLFLGAGELANYRWESFSKRGELHSSIGTVVFSYGIPGTLLMAGFIGLIMRRGGWRIVPYMIPELMFSVTHMGLRFVMTWVYFVMLFLVACEWQKERAARRLALMERAQESLRHPSGAPIGGSIQQI